MSAVARTHATKMVIGRMFGLRTVSLCGIYTVQAGYEGMIPTPKDGESPTCKSCRRSAAILSAKAAWDGVGCERASGGQV